MFGTLLDTADRMTEKANARVLRNGCRGLHKREIAIRVSTLQDREQEQREVKSQHHGNCSILEV